MSASPSLSPIGREAIAGIVDPLWTRIRGEAETVLRDEPQLASFFVATILNHPTLEAAVGHRVAARLGHASLPTDLVAHGFYEAVNDDPTIGQSMRADILAVMDRDPRPRGQSSRCSISRASMPCRRIASPIGTGIRDGAISPSTCKAGRRRCSRPTSIPQPASGAACSSITPRVSWWDRPP